MSSFAIGKVAVLGAGVMGAQIAAHLANVQVPVLLFDLASPEGPKSAIAARAVEGLKKIKPSPLALPAYARAITACNYDDDVALLQGCDLIIEAIAERMDYKQALFRTIAPHVPGHAIVASNTSGLSIAQLAAALPEPVAARFCGIHFFNPPRYMYLVELVAAPATQPGTLDALETFVTRVLGKGVVRAKDTPNFIANRVGVAGLLSTLHEAQLRGLTPDVVDDLTGKKLGRASSGTYRTADVVGLDTMAHVIGTLQQQLSVQTDPFYDQFATPPVLQALLALGHLGQKTKAGFFKKEGRDILRFDLATESYVPANQKADEVYARMLAQPAPQRLHSLRHAQGAQGQFLWAVLRNAFHYAAVHLAHIADTARDVDCAMQWGFGMQQGPFELWQEAGWLQVAQWIAQDIEQGLAWSSAPLPDWVWHGPVAQAQGVHTAQGSWNPTTACFEPRRVLPVYQRQYVPPSLWGEGAPTSLTAGHTVYEDAAIRLWTLQPAGTGVDTVDTVLIATIRTKMHLINMAVAQGLCRAVEMAERDHAALVVWSGDEVFSAGADLQSLLPVFMQSGVSAIEAAQKQLQDTMQRIRYAQVPVVVALRGLALGGGCELAMHAARRVAHMESYVGLVEMGVGLVPGAGGLTCLARQAADHAAQAGQTQLLPFLMQGFTAVAMATVSTSAPEARKLGYLQPGDTVVAHAHELLAVAVDQARALAFAGWRPPVKATFAVAGRSAKATIMGQLLNMREGGFISVHDQHIATLVAHVLCGGDVEAGAEVTESYLLALERQAFCSLIVHPPTQERIVSMLNTGKPLRN